jgi:ribosomal protein S18 acetylase RimI-like enzyme
MMITVENAKSKDKYISAWIKGMQHLHWFNESRLFDYNRKEMIEELSRDFCKPFNIFLEVTLKKSKEILGVLGIKLHREVGVLRRWEPAVPLKERSSGAGEVLIEKALQLLQREGAKKAVCMIKYPYDLPETAEWHINLYKKSGFKQREPIGLQLLADLSRTGTLMHSSSFRITTKESYTLEDFANFTLKAYASTPEDKAIHEWDPFVSVREKILEGLLSIKNGKLGFSPPELWKIGLVKDKPAGFAVSFMPEDKYRPTYGVIGLIGVFPKFRRKGVAYALIVEMHKCFRKYGCHYAYVGTPKTNKKAVNLYKKVGYTPVFEIINFEKQL